MPADENSGIVCLLLNKEWFWWEVASVSIPGGWYRQVHGRSLNPVSEHAPVYYAVLDLPPNESQSHLKMIWGETILDGKTARLKTTDQNMEFAIVQAKRSGYFYFFIPHDQYLPVGESLSIELNDGAVIPVSRYQY